MNHFFEKLEKAIEQLKAIEPQQHWSSEEYQDVLKIIRNAEEAVIQHQLAGQWISEGTEKVPETEKSVEPEAAPISMQPISIRTEENTYEQDASIDSAELSVEQEGNENKAEEEDSAQEKPAVPTETDEKQPGSNFTEEDEMGAEEEDAALRNKIEEDAQSMGADSAVELNERNKAEDNSLANRMQRTPISDLKASIGLNERFLFANELFDGNMESFNRALNELNHIDSLEGANLFINAQLKERFNWNDESEITLRFLNLVERRFL